ncbi:MAG: DUF255 domain-containing protein [Bacteroidales bacterium]|nr:DUF255 domain-containing protein [Bacteroidales bacterium]MBN2757921.1 DUF255 domain-containing protein [Bacteroidales bacterium]
MKNLIYVIIFLLFFEYTLSQNTNNIIDTNKVEWLNFETALSKFKEKQKPVLIFFDNPDMDSCNVMLNQTFGNEEVSNYINILFYPIKLNSYSKDSIKFFDGTVYTNSGANGKYHDLVVKLGALDSGFPSLLMFTKEANGTIFGGFKDRNQIFPILIYYAEEAYNATTYENFEKYYYKTYPPGQKQIMTRVLVKWRTFDEAMELNKQIPKKIFINIYDNYSMSSTMMNLKTYNNKQIAEYLNNKFYCINLNVREKEEINFLDKKFINEGLSHEYHQLAISLLNGKMKFPAFLIFDEKINYLDKMQKYMTPEDFEPLIYFIGKNAYKTEKWPDFLKSFESKLIKE